MKCPNCQTELSVAPVLEEQTLYFDIEYPEANKLMAKTVHGVLSNAEKLLQSIGKDMGIPVQVFLDSVEQTPGKLRFGLLLMFKRK